MPEIPQIRAASRLGILMHTRKEVTMTTDTTIPSRRALLAGAPAAAAALAAGTVNGLAMAAASPSAADPIFAVIVFSSWDT
jgi:hypothetical protein